MATERFDRTVVQEPSIGRPHLVILGAGATLATFPNGDRSGRKMPLMHNVVEVCGLEPILDRHGLEYTGNDFEAFFSEIYAEGKHLEAIEEIERAIFDYFAAMQLPDEPTLYDHMVLALRPKDVIATFNWDPFLFQAMARNHEFTKMPTALFLHGNAAVGYCLNHQPASIGPRDGLCGQCGRPRETSQLLYPVGQKDYSSDSFIAKTWSVIQDVLRDAYVVTVFGYSAPVTDVEAVELLKSGWGDTGKRQLEEIEIIDIKDEDHLCATWNPFIHSHHYRCANEFYDSLIANHPRRTCDAMWAQLMEVMIIDRNPLPRDASWDDLYGWFESLIHDEQDYAKKTSKV